MLSVITFMELRKGSLPSFPQNIGRTKTRAVSRPQVNLGSLARIHGGKPAKVLNPNESKQRVQTQLQAGRKNMPLKREDPLGLTPLPIRRPLPSYSR